MIQTERPPLPPRNTGTSAHTTAYYSAYEYPMASTASVAGTAAPEYPAEHKTTSYPLEKQPVITDFAEKNGAAIPNGTTSTVANGKAPATQVSTSPPSSVNGRGASINGHPPIVDQDKALVASPVDLSRHATGTFADGAAISVGVIHRLFHSQILVQNLRISNSLLVTQKV
jgi:hypothetical protein